MKKEDIKNELDPDLQNALDLKAGDHKAIIMILLIQLIRLVRDVKAKIK